MSISAGSVTTAVPAVAPAAGSASAKGVTYPERMPRARIGPRRAGPLAPGRGDRTGCLPPGARSGGIVGVGWGKVARGGGQWPVHHADRRERCLVVVEGVGETVGAGVVFRQAAQPERLLG